MKDIPYSKEQLMKANMKLMEQNKRYREALEEISQKRITYADMAGTLRIAREALEGTE